MSQLLPSRHDLLAKRAHQQRVRHTRRSHNRQLLLEGLEPRQMLTAGVLDLQPIPWRVVENQPHDGLVATFRSPNAVSHDFAAIISWDDQGLTSTAMVRPYADRFGVFATHTYAEAGWHTFTVDVYDVDSNSPIKTSVMGNVDVSNGQRAFDHVTIRALPENLAFTEGQTLGSTIPLMTFTDTRTDRNVNSYVATIGGLPSSQATITAGPDSTYQVRYAGTPHLFSEETVGQLTVTIQANGGAESLSTEIPYVVLGAPIDVTPRVIPTPYLPSGQPSKSIDTWLATFTDPDLLSGPQEFTAVIRWGDGSVENDELSTNVWITGSAGSFSVWGRHTFPAPGTYPIIVEVSEDQHSRDSAVSSVVIGTPTVPPLGQIWSRMYCDGSTLIGTGSPPLDFNVLNQTARGLGTTLEGQPGVAFVNAVVGSFEYANEAGASLSALVRWEASGNWESATVSGGHIVGTHTYTAPGSYPIEVVLVLDDTYRALDEVTQLCTTYPRQRTVSIYSGATIVTPSPVVTTHAKTVSAGSSFAAKDLVTAAALTAKAVAIVEWGDGTQSLEEFDATSQLVGSHTYTSPGHYTAQITVRQAEQTVVELVQVTVTPQNAYADPLMPLDARSTVTVHADLLEQDIALAMIRDTNPRHIGGLHEALISWGDGATGTLGQIKLDVVNEYAIKASHVYHDAGVYNVRFGYKDQFDEVAFQGSIVVEPMPLLEVPCEVNAGKGVEREDWIVAQFTTQDLEIEADHFDAVIDWGDGLRNVGRVVGDGGLFSIYGSHTYWHPGSYQIKVDTFSGYGTRQTLTMRTPVHVTEVSAGPVESIKVAEYELLDWHDSASGGGPDPPPPPMGPLMSIGLTARDVTLVRGPGQEWVYTGTRIPYRGPGSNDSSSGREADNSRRRILYNDLNTTESLTLDGGDLPGTPAVSHVIRAHWDDSSLPTPYPGYLHLDPFAPGITQAHAWHVYDADSFTSVGGEEKDLVGEIYGVNLARDLFVADGTVQVTETPGLIYGFEDQPLDDVLAVAFTKAEFAETDVQATIHWGDGTRSTETVIVRPDNTLALLLDHVYAEEGQYTLAILLQSEGHAWRVVTADVQIINRELTFEPQPFAAAEEVWTGDVPLATIPAEAWHAPWEALVGEARAAARAAFRPEEFFAIGIDWGDGTRSGGRVIVDPTTDALVILGDHTYAAGTVGTRQIHVKFEDRSAVAAVFITTVEIVNKWNFAAFQRTNGFFEGLAQAAGQAEVLLNTGALRIGHELDFDISPGTDVGGNPRLVYDSQTAQARPIIEGHVTTGADGTRAVLPVSADVQLTWNHRVAQPWTTFDPSGHALGDTLLVGAQVTEEQPVEQSGLFPWTLQTRLHFAAATVLYMAQQGEAQVIAKSEGDLHPADDFDNEPFYGTGWDISLLDRLIVHSNRDLLWVDGNGYTRKYSYQADGTYEPDSPSDFGSLVFDPGLRAVAYTDRDRTVHTFNHLGLLTTVTTPSTGTTVFAYDTEGRVTTIQTPDVFTTTFDYIEFRLSYIHESGSRNVNLVHAGSITRINDVDGTFRGLNYDGDNHLISDLWGVLNTTIVYDTTTGAVTQVNRGLGTVYQIDAAATAWYASPMLNADDALGTWTDPLSRVTEATLDAEGRITRQTGPDGASLSGSHERTWERNTSHKQPNLITGPEGSQSIGYDEKGLPATIMRDGVTYTIDPQSLNYTSQSEYRMTHLGYDDLFGQIESVTDELSHTTGIKRDPVSGLPVEVEDAHEEKSNYQWTNGRLTQETDRLGHTTHFVYDAHLRLIRTIDPLGGVTERTYDSAGNLATIQDALGRVTEYEYDRRNRLVRTTDPYQHDTELEYDASGLVTEQTSANNVRTVREYDQRGFLRQVHEAVGTLIARTSLMNYDAAGNLAEEIDPLGRHTCYAYDTLDRRISTLDPAGGLSLFVYDTAGNLVQERDAALRWTSHAYDLDGRRTATLDALGGLTLWEYDDVGNLECETDAEGYITRYEYDALNRRTRLIDARLNSEYYAYDEEGNRTAVTDKLGHVTLYAYDANDRLIVQTNPHNRTRLFAYDAVGNVVAQTDEMGFITTFGYDALNRRVSETNPLQGTRAFAYDAVGNLVGQTDELGRLTTFAYDALNRQVGTTNPLQGTRTYVFDAADNRLQETNERGAVTLWQYDALDRRIAETDALGHTATFSYDAVGNLLVETNRRGFATTSVYDALNRRIRQIDALSGVREFAYDAVGNLVEETDELGRDTSYAYDGLRRRTVMVNRAGDAHGYAYDPVGNLLAEIDEEEREWTYNYDWLNRRTFSEDPTGAQRSYIYDEVGNLVREIDERDNETTYVWDALRRRTQQTNALAGVHAWSYDAVGNLLVETDELAHATTHVYDALNRQTQLVDALQGTHTWGYDAVGNVLSQTDANGHTTQFTYDLLNRRTEVRDATNHASTTLYDAEDNVTQEIDALGHATFYSYDALDRRTGQLDRLGGVTAWQYSVVGNLVAQEDPEERVTTFYYDVLNRRIAVHEPGGAIHQTTYDGVGNVLSQTDANGHTTQFSYDGRDRLLATLDALSGVSFRTYDQAGNLLTDTDPLGHTTAYQYDALHRPTHVTNPLLQTTVSTYDAVGNVVRVTDPLGHETNSTFDALYRLTAVEDPEGGTTEYEYDAVGNRTQLTDPVGNETTWTYDALDRVTREENELGAARTFVYDAVSNLTRRTDRLDREIEYDYDALQRRTAEHWLGANQQILRTIEYAYDGLSRLTGVEDPDSSYAYTYNVAGQVAAVEHDVVMLGHTARLEQTFDAQGNRLQVQAKLDGVNDFLNQYTYDALNRITRIQQQGTAVPKRFDFTYDAASQFATLARYQNLSGTAAVVTSTYTWDAAGRLTDLDHGTLANYGWSYDAANRLTQMTSPDGSSTFTYDDTDQVLTADYSFQTDESFTFDAAGNRTLTGYTVGDNNQTLSDGIFSYTYDAEGNRLTRTHLTSGAVVQYSWDYRNRLVGIVERNAQQQVVKTVTYRYDPLNRRMAKEVAPAFGPSTVEHFLYDAGAGGIDGDQQIAWQFQSGGTVTHRYLHGPAVDQVLADEQVGGSTAQVLYPLADQLGSVRDLADYDEQLGITQIAQHLVYDAFGRIQMAIPSTPSHLFGYTGREYDTESGLSYYRARYYDAALGQFLNEDPLGFDAQDPNLRRYVGNGPLDAVDPSGLDSIFLAGDEVFYSSNNNNSSTAQPIIVGPVYSIGQRLGKHGPILLSEQFGGGYAGIADLQAVAAGLTTTGIGFKLTEDRIRQIVESRIRRVSVNPNAIFSLYNKLSPAYGGWLQGAAALRNGIDRSKTDSITDAVVEQSLSCRNVQVKMAVPFGNAEVGEYVAYFSYVEPGWFTAGGYLTLTHFGPGTGSLNEELKSQIAAGDAAHVESVSRVIPIYGQLATLADPRSLNSERNLAVSLLFLDMAGVYSLFKGTAGSGANAAARAGGRAAPGATLFDEVAPRAGNVVELEVGPFGHLARRSVRDGLTPDHIPSFASVRAHVERQIGRQLTAAEEAALRNQTNAIVVRTRSHMDVSRTYGGRNTPQQILQDSLDQQRAFQLDRQAWRQRLLDEGHTPQAIDDAFRLLDDLNRQAGRY